MSVLRLMCRKGRRKWRSRPATPDVYEVWLWDGGVGRNLSGGRDLSLELATALAKRLSKQMGVPVESPGATQ